MAGPVADAASASSARGTTWEGDAGDTETRLPRMRRLFVSGAAASSRAAAAASSGAPRASSATPVGAAAAASSVGKYTSSAIMVSNEAFCLVARRTSLDGVCHVTAFCQTSSTTYLETSRTAILARPASTITCRVVFSRPHLRTLRKVNAPTGEFYTLVLPRNHLAHKRS